MVWWRLLIAVIMLVGVLKIAFDDEFNKLIKNPRRWMTQSWWRTLGVVGVILFVAILIVPNVHAVTEGFIGREIVDRSSHAQVQISAISPWLMLGVALVLAFVEELIFRAGFLEFFKNRYNQWLGLGLSSLAFAMYHLIDPSIGFLFVIPGIVAGGFFGLAYLRGGLVGSFLTHGLYNMVVLLPALI